MNKTRGQRDSRSASSEKIGEDIRKLVIERIKASSGDLRISIGSEECTKEEILESVRKGDERGKEIIEAQMRYLRDIAKGRLYKQDE